MIMKIISQPRLSQSNLCCQYCIKISLEINVWGDLLFDNFIRDDPTLPKIKPL